MDFTPKSNWQWLFNKETKSLILQMGDHFIDISYKSSMLVLPDNNPIPFTVEDVARYTELIESPALKEYQGEFACKIILHILAAELFHKPIMPKSWLFATSTAQCEKLIDPMSHISLTASKGNESAHYLVLEDEKEFALCMLIDKVHQLTPRKSLSQFQIIKVTLDKLSLIKTIDDTNWHSFQIA